MQCLGFFFWDIELRVDSGMVSHICHQYSVLYTGLTTCSGMQQHAYHFMLWVCRSVQERAVMCSDMARSMQWRAVTCKEHAEVCRSVQECAVMCSDMQRACCEVQECAGSVQITKGQNHALSFFLENDTQTMTCWYMEALTPLDIPYSQCRIPRTGYCDWVIMQYL